MGACLVSALVAWWWVHKNPVMRRIQGHMEAGPRRQMTDFACYVSPYCGLNKHSTSEQLSGVLLDPKTELWG